MISPIARHVAFIYPQFNLIEVSGPLDAFATATEMAPDSYRFTIMALEGGEVRSWSGAKVTSEIAGSVTRHAVYAGPCAS
jgi:transcriptional regulator GlxA family with amidase domain